VINDDAWAKTVSARQCGWPHHPRAWRRPHQLTDRRHKDNGRRVRLPPGSGSLGADALRGDGW